MTYGNNKLASIYIHICAPVSYQEYRIDAAIDRLDYSHMPFDSSDPVSLGMHVHAACTWIDHYEIDMNGAAADRGRVSAAIWPPAACRIANIDRLTPQDMLLAAAVVVDASRRSIDAMWLLINYWRRVHGLLTQLSSAYFMHGCMYS